MFGKQFIDHTAQLGTERSTLRYLTVIRKCVSHRVRAGHSEAQCSYPRIEQLCKHTAGMKTRFLTVGKDGMIQAKRRRE